MSSDATVRDTVRPTLASRAAGIWGAANRYAVVLLLLIGIFLFFSLTQPDFFSRANIENLLTGSSILFVVSIGMTFVVLTGGIDLSVGSLLALSGIILSQLFNDVGRRRSSAVP
jgi:ribose transport system permease protein